MLTLIPQKFSHQVLAPTLVGLTILSIYLLSPVSQTGGDSHWTIYLAQSLIQEGNLDLDEYEHLIPAGDYRVKSINAHIQSYFPVGTAIAVVPFVLLDNLITHHRQNNIEAHYARLDKTIACILTAIASVIIYLIAHRLLPTHEALVITTIFAFGTAAWSTTSRALWSHGPSMIAVSMALYIGLLAGDRPKLIQFAAIPLCFGYVIRPTNSISIILFAGLIIARYREYLPRYLFWCICVLACFIGYSYATYHAILPPYYLPGRLSNGQNIGEALVGNLISPSRGLLVFSPIFLLAFYGFHVTRKSHIIDRPLVTLSLAAVGLHWIMISRFPHWWGGHSYGPRLFCDIIPYLVFLLIPAIAQISKNGMRSGWVMMGLLFLISALINFRGATDDQVNQWNAKPVSVDLVPARVWDFGDAQFLRNIPFLDALIPPLMWASPSRVDVLAEQSEQTVVWRSVRVYDLRGRDVNWSVKSLPPAVISTISGAGMQGDVLELALSIEETEIGTRYLDPIVIIASRIPIRFLQTVTLSIPVRLSVGNLYREYLPLINR